MTYPLESSLVLIDLYPLFTLRDPQSLYCNTKNKQQFCRNYGILRKTSQNIIKTRSAQPWISMDRDDGKGPFLFCCNINVQCISNFFWGGRGAVGLGRCFFHCFQQGVGAGYKEGNVFTQVVMTMMEQFPRV